MAENLSPQRKETFEKFVSEIMTVGNSAGMAVGIFNKDGVMQYENYFGFRDEEKQLPIDGNTIFGLASLTKSFVAISVMQLAEAGKIDLDDPVSKYCPYFTNKNQSKPVKIKHLLSHSGGFFPLHRTVVTDVAKALGISEDKVGDFGYYAPLAEKSAQIVAEQMDNEKNLIGPPGDRMSYCNDGFGILSYIVGKIGGANSFSQYVLENILEPLHMERSFCDFVKPSLDSNSAQLYYFEGNERLHSKDYHNNAFALNGAGSMKSTLNDMVKYIGMWLNKGRGLNGKRLISPYSVREILKPRQYYSHHAFYGYGVINRCFDEFTTFEHSGGLPGVSSYMCWCYDLNIGIIVLCNTENTAAGAVADLAFRLISGKEITLTRLNMPIISWDEKFIKKAIGEYPSNEGDGLKIFEDGTLKLNLNGGIYDINPISANKAIIRSKFSDRLLEFLENEEGEIWAARCGSSIFPKKSEGVESHEKHRN